MPEAPTPTANRPWAELGLLLARLANMEAPAPQVRSSGDEATTLVELSRALGFRAHPLTGTFPTLRRALENGALLVRVPADARPEPLLVLSDVDRRGRVRVHQVPVDAPGAWLAESELELLLGKSGWSLTTWMLLRTARPLEALRSPAGAAPKSAARRLLALASMEREDLKAVTIFASVVGLLSVATPVAVQALVNSIAFGTLLQPIVVLATILFAVLAFSGLLIVVETYVLEMFERRLFLRAAEDISARLPAVAAAGRAHPELVNRFFEVFALQKATNQLLLDGLDLLLKLVIGLVLLAVYHPLLLAFDAFIVVGLGLVLWVGKKGPEAARYKSKAKYRFVAWLEQLTFARDTFGRPDGRRLAAIESEQRALHYLSTRTKYFRILLTQKIGLVSLQAFAGAGLLGLGGVLVLKGRLSLGELVAAELILAATVSAFAKLGKQLGILYEALASTDKLGQLLDAGTEPVRAGASLQREGTGLELVLSRLSVRDDALGLHLGDVDLHVAPGEVVWLEDRDGGQASGLFDAILGRARVSSGRIDIGGRDHRDLPEIQLSETVTLLRSTECFDGTIEDHLWLGAEERDPKACARVLDELELTARVEELSEGLKTRLAPFGGPLTEPEKILLMVARTALARPPIIMVDAFLDRLPRRLRTKALSALRSSSAEAIVLMRTEVEDLARLADRHVVIERGGIEEVRR